MLNKKVSVIELLRGIAAVAVALFHFGGQLSSPIPKFFQAYGWLGVDVFFIISGFVITLSMIRTNYEYKDLPIFLSRRFVRLEPPYLISILLVILLWHMSSKVPGYGGVAPHYSGTQILAHFLYFIPLTDHDWLSPVYWSLAYEFVFYIFAALTFPFFAKRDPLATLVCAAFIVALKKTIAGNLDHRIFEFAFGVILARLTTETILSRNILAASLSLFFIFLTGGSLVALVLLVTGSAIYGLRKVEFGYLAFAIGGISYSLYLTHTTVGGRIINLGKRFSDGPTQELSLLVVALTVSLLFAFLYSKAIENPAIIIAHRIKTTRFK